MEIMSNEFKTNLEEYIKANYIENSDKEIDYTVLEGLTKGAGKTFGQDKVLTLDEIIDEVGESFHEKLFLKIDMSGMTDVEVYKRAGLDRKLFSKIRSNPAYHPKKQTVLALAIALKLNLEETMDLLSRAEYALSPGNKGDLIVKYFIEHEVYDIQAINFALYEYDQPILG